MKIIASVAVLLFLLSTFTFTPQAKAEDIGALLAGICETVATDNKSRFRKKISDTGVKLRNIYDGITCGGENLVRYAMQNGANDVGEFIVKRMPASHFDTSGDTEWAAANGLTDNPVAQAIANR